MIDYFIRCSKGL